MTAAVDASVVVVSGNPRAGSRTSSAASEVGRQVASHLGAPAPVILELSEVGSELFALSRPRTDRYLSTLARASVAIIATPVYKASYTGLLKSFLDLYPAGGLSAVVTVPLVVSGSPAHLRAADDHLRSLLSELGTRGPTPSVALVEAELTSLDVKINDWAVRSLDVLAGAVGAVREDANRLSVGAEASYFA